MSERLKQLVQEIQKYAQSPTRSRGPKGGTPAATPPPGKPGGANTVPTRGGTTPKPTGGGGTFVGAASIREMQQAIQNFATESVKYKTSPKREGNKITYEVNQDDKRRDFNDFLAEQFSASADIHGQEYSTEAKDTTKQSKLPTDLVQLNNVIDGLQRIGPGSKERMADGVWDFRTNNAVRNVYAIAAAMVTAQESLGGTAPNDKRVFSRADLSKLNDAIPEQADPMKAKVPQADLAEKAKQITPLVEKLTEFYKYYSKMIIEHPAYTRYIKGDIPLFTVKPGGGDPAKLTPDQQKLYDEKGKTMTLPALYLKNKQGKWVNFDNQITLDFFANRNNLYKLLTDKLGYNQNEVYNGPLLVKIVQTVLDQVNEYLTKNKPIPKPVQQKPEPQPAQVNKQTPNQVA